MPESIDHDRLFKELISTFFVEFIELFFPQVMTYLDSESVTFLDKEIFTDVTEGEKYETDLIAQVKFQGQSSFFLVHVEAQSSADNSFNRRMFLYFSRLHQKFSFPVYPIVIFSYDSPIKEATSEYLVEFPDFKVLQFNYKTIQLNRLNWRDYLNQANPVASALMAKMMIAEKDRPKVKAECLRLLAKLKLNPARMQLISGFVDTYLKLNQIEEIEFKKEVSTFSNPEQESVMQ
ncbi:MAG: Rpn family recombination-promoting nuclease/putative transposase, partial [Cyanobacteriota bacterium ELA615]